MIQRQSTLDAEGKPLPIEPLLKVLLWPGPRTVFEIGACEAEHTPRYLRIFPAARFLLFEPLPRNVRSIEDRMRSFPGRDIRIFPLALSESRGTATFHVSSGQPASAPAAPPGEEPSRSSSLLAPSPQRPSALDWLNFAETIEVPTETLGDFCRDRSIGDIDFVHMDVQGAELMVLRGAGEHLRRIRCIWMEVAFEKTYEGQPLEPETTRWMAEQGFVKLAQVSYGPEGDALYYNLRQPLGTLRCGLLKFLQRLGWARMR